MSTSPWTPISTPPKEGDIVDVWARQYDNAARKWVFKRFTDVRYGNAQAGAPLSR